jgi:hypothetical protein
MVCNREKLITGKKCLNMLCHVWSFVLIILAIVLSVLDLRFLIIPLVRVAQFLVSVYCLLIIVCPFVLILLAAIVLSVFERSFKHRMQANADPQTADVKYFQDMA